MRCTKLREATLVTGTVDRANGVVKGVKVCGFLSVNSHGQKDENGRLASGTTYTRAALEGALSLYEGAAVNADHLPRKSTEERSVKDRVGFLRNARLGKTGVFADLVFLNPNEDLAKRVMAAAQIKPDSFAMSHDADGVGDVVDGRFVVNEIVEVRGVDLVSQGGSNVSLFESLREQKKMDYRDHLHEARKMCEDAGDHETAAKIHKLLTPGDGEDEELREDVMEDEAIERPAGYRGGTPGKTTKESLESRPWTAQRLRERREPRVGAKNKDEFFRRLRRAN